MLPPVLSAVSILGQVFVVLAFGGSGHVCAQNTCADLEIVSVQYAAFNDSTIEVVAHTTPGSFFSYPSFRLLNEQNDTLTSEQVNFFGISQAPQTHFSVLRDGFALPSSPFTGTLLLSFSGPGEENYCSFPWSGSLCPPTPCVEMEVLVYRQAVPPLISTSFDWSVSDAAGNLESGTLSIDAATGQLDVEDLCLPIGHYTMHIEHNGTTGDGFQFGVGQRNFTVTGPIEELSAGGEADLPFTIHGHCIESGNSVADHARPLSTLALDGRTLHLNTTGDAIGPVEILDSSGRVVHRSYGPSSTFRMDLNGLACGLYVVRTGPSATSRHSLRFLLH